MLTVLVDELESPEARGDDTARLVKTAKMEVESAMNFIVEEYVRDSS